MNVWRRRFAKTEFRPSMEEEEEAIYGRTD